METLWQRFETWLATHAPPLLEELDEGASEWDIRESEEELEVSFPRAFKDFLSVHNGGTVANGLLGNWDLYSLDEVAEEAFAMEEKVDDGDYGSNTRMGLDTYVKPLWWNPNWLPFAGSGNGHYLCVDLDPGPEGTVGQVILYFYDSGERPVLAKGMEEWFTDIVQRLEKGEVSVSYDKTLDNWYFDQPGLLNLKDA